VLRGRIALGLKKEKVMKPEPSSFAPVNRRSLPRVLFAAGAMLLATVSACSAASNASAPETFRGIVASANERNDTLTIQLSATGASNDFRVQDGLLFNAVRYGDRVEITVETIDGAKTIIALKNE
jgi:hypothetical protein